MFEQNKIYLEKFSLLLIIIQLALTIYVIIGLENVILSVFYASLLSYSVLLALVPVLFGLFILISKNLPHAFEYSYNDSNGFIRNGNGHIHDDNLNKDSDTYGVSVYLIMLGVIMFSYNILLRIMLPPLFIAILIPVLILLFILKNQSLQSY